MPLDRGTEKLDPTSGSWDMRNANTHYFVNGIETLNVELRASLQFSKFKYSTLGMVSGCLIFIACFHYEYCECELIVIDKGVLKIVQKRSFHHLWTHYCKYLMLSS